MIIPFFCFLLPSFPPLIMFQPSRTQTSFCIPSICVHGVHSSLRFSVSVEERNFGFACVAPALGAVIRMQQADQEGGMVQSAVWGGKNETEKYIIFERMKFSLLCMSFFYCTQSKRIHRVCTLVSVGASPCHLCRCVEAREPGDNDAAVAARPFCCCCTENLYACVALAAISARSSTILFYDARTPSPPCLTIMMVIRSCGTRNPSLWTFSSSTHREFLCGYLDAVVRWATYQNVSAWLSLVGLPASC